MATQTQSFNLKDYQAFLADWGYRPPASAKDSIEGIFPNGTSVSTTPSGNTAATSAVSRVIPLVQPDAASTNDFYKDKSGRVLWTFYNSFQWGLPSTEKIASLLNPFSRGNDYVAEVWSPKYVKANMHDAKLVATAGANIFRALGDFDFKGAGCHFLNFLMVLGLWVFNVEIPNFFKSVSGIIISAVKIPVHFVKCLVYLVWAAIQACRGQDWKEPLREALANFGFIFKDVVSIIACVGHLIPWWLPIVLQAIPVFGNLGGLVLALIKIGCQFAGATDLTAYVIGLALIRFDLWAAKRDLKEMEHIPADERNERQQQIQAKALERIEAWDTMIKQLKDPEGGALVAFGTHLVISGAAAGISIIPGGGAAASAVSSVLESNYVAYGTSVAVGGIYAGYRHYKNKMQQVASQA